MKLKYIKYLITQMLVFSSITIYGQSNSSIDYVIADARVDTLIIMYDLISDQAAENIWIEIYDGSTKLNPIAISGDIGSNIKPGRNKKIIWCLNQDGIDLADHQISLTLKANVPNVSVPEQDDVVIQEPKEEIIQKEKVQATYPLFRPGIEIGVGDILGNSAAVKATLTFEYILKPWLSIHSGVGYINNYIETAIPGDYGYTYSQNCQYGSIIVPLTAELKLNTGRWFRLYGGGGIMNRYMLNETDETLSFGEGLKKYVIGLKADAGIEIRNLRLGVSYEKDLTAYSVFNEKLTVLNVILGVRIGGSKAYIKN